MGNSHSERKNICKRCGKDIDRNQILCPGCKSMFPKGFFICNCGNIYDDKYCGQCYDECECEELKNRKYNQCRKCDDKYIDL